jgi:hypothetical protein
MTTAMVAQEKPQQESPKITLYLPSDIASETLIVRMAAGQHPDDFVYEALESRIYCSSLGRWTRKKILLEWFFVG